MEKKMYLAPEAELVVFYSKEDIANLSLNSEGGSEGGVLEGGTGTASDPDDGWEL